MMYDIRINRENNIRIEGFPRVNIKGIEKLISKI
jgi:hypothetical protein